MKILSQNLQKGYVKLSVENLDDLWSLSYIIEEEDIIKARTFRKIKLGKESGADTEIIKKPVFLSVKIERVEFHKYASILRASGIIIEGPDDIPNGSHHTINIEEGTVFELIKEKFLKYQIDKLNDAKEENNSKILIVVHDREDAFFALLKKYGFVTLTNIHGNVAKKEESGIKADDFYSEIKAAIEDYDKKYNFSSIIIASPGFFKEYLLKKLTDSIRSKVIIASCSDVGESGINELIKRPEVHDALKKEHIAKEMVLIEKLLSEISKEGAVAYGFNEVYEAVAAGAVSDILVTDGLILKKRQDNDFSALDTLMKKTDNMNGFVHIISSDHDGGKKLDGLGGVAALLRYKLSY
ncbi:MAG: mRNA surveillance protein pelota [archaeon]